MKYTIACNKEKDPKFIYTVKHLVEWKCDNCKNKQSYKCNGGCIEIEEESVCQK